MHKTAKTIPLLLLAIMVLITGTLINVSCSSGASGNQATATTDSKYADTSLADLIDMTTHRLAKAIEFTRLMNQDIRVTGEIGTLSAGGDPSSWEVTIVVPGDQNAGPLVLDMADTAFQTLVDPGNPDGLKTGSAVTVEGEFTGVNKAQLPVLFVHNIIFNGTTYKRPVE